MGHAWHRSIIVRGHRGRGWGHCARGVVRGPVAGRDSSGTGTVRHGPSTRRPACPCRRVRRVVTAARPFVAGTPQRNRGTTWSLAGALVAVGVIVLGAIAVPVFLDQRDRAQEAAVQSDLRNTALEFEDFVQRPGRLPLVPVRARVGVRRGRVHRTRVRPTARPSASRPPRATPGGPTTPSRTSFRTGRC